MIWPAFTAHFTLPVHRYLDDEADLALGGGAAWLVWQHEDVHDDVPFAEFFDRFCADVPTGEITELLFGSAGGFHGSSSAAVDALAAAAGRFPALRKVALGAIEREEREMSWIKHGDVTPLLEALPDLEVLEIRGSDGLTLRPVAHRALRVLRCESGGLPDTFLAGLAASDLPALETLELWLGADGYGASWKHSSLEEILQGERLPALRFLGLMDSDEQDRIAERVAVAPVVARLRSLSLAMGTLTDAGAEALLAGQPLTHLRALSLHHHYLTEPMEERLRAALPTVAVDLFDRRTEEEYGGFYVAEAE